MTVLKSDGYHIKKSIAEELLELASRRTLGGPTTANLSLNIPLAGY